MRYPGYRLNPGDMFQVEPDRVLFATGASKDKQERRAGRVLRSRTSTKGEDAKESSKKTPSLTASPSSEPPTPEDPADSLKELLEQAKDILSKPTADLTAKRKQSLRAFQRTLRRTISRRTSLTDSLDAQLLEMAHNLNISLPNSERPTEPDAYDSPAPTPTSTNNIAVSKALTDVQAKLLKDALADANENPIDSRKPYATPWRPREYLSAFAFVPRYLEVHHKVCSAVYLRHPVARPSLAEVPTPYNIEQNGLAFNWYLRRR